MITRSVPDLDERARITIRGLYGDITYPVTSPLAITMGFAACEAA